MTHAITSSFRAAHTDPSNSSAPSARERQQFLADVLEGLGQEQKYLDCKYLYDRRGSQLFDRICELDEYYPTRTELSIMRQYASEMGACLGRAPVVVELGSGSSVKTRLLLASLSQPQAYLPVDISEEHLYQSAADLQREFPQLDIHPLVADFTERVDLPPGYRRPSTSCYFPGSTIGNLTASAAIELLTSIASLCGSKGGVLIGFDLVKDVAVLEQAYNDGKGITAAFNLNLLRRINRELGADFDLDQFAHVAYFDQQESRVEIYIESKVSQSVTLNGRQITFAPGERILTEYSHKYTLESFSGLAMRAGLEPVQWWMDSDQYFCVMYLRGL